MSLYEQVMDRIEKMNEVAATMVPDVDGDPEAFFDALVEFALSKPETFDLPVAHFVYLVAGFQVRAVCANA